MERIKALKKNIFAKKRFLVPAVLILIIAGYFLFRPSNNVKNTVTDFAKVTNLKQTVLATGQVVSKIDLSLSFNTSGVVRKLNVSVGDKVKTGDVLATLDQGGAYATLIQARGALAGANAKLERIIAGASNEEIALSKIALENAIRDYENVKNTQDNLVSNAYNNVLNSTPEAVPESGTGDYSAPTISGTYSLGKEGTINVSIYNGSNFSVAGLTNGNGTITTTTAQPLGNSGLYIKFPSTGINVSNWVINIPNKKASTYLTNYNLYQAALKTEQSALSSAQSLVDQRTAELAIKQAQARPSDIDLAKADVLSAEGQLQLAEAKYNDTIIRAPAPGTITKVDIKIGELAQALKEIITLQDISNIYLESNINEANIRSLNVGMPIEITYDAFTEDSVFKGAITQIDPSSTLISGVVNYKVTASVENTEGLRPGMTANMTIKVKEKDGVLVVPERAILTNEAGEKTIRLITNTKTKAYKEVPITTGLRGDGGLVEVTSGLSLGDEFVVLIKK